jgi:hypothetical protein
VTHPLHQLAEARARGGRRVEGGPAGRRTAIGYADPGPGGHSPGFGAYEEGRDKAVDRDNQPTIS